MRRGGGRKPSIPEVAAESGASSPQLDRAELAPDSLAPEQVRRRLRGRFGRPYRYVEECASTQLLLLGSELPEGAVAVAEYQTAGRGRRGRSWVAPAGSSILVSILLRPPPARRAPELSLVSALAVAAAIESETGAAALVKWPNDVLVAGRKVAGILAELAEGAVVVGIGVNVRQTEDELPLDAPTPAGSLRTVASVMPGRATLLAAILAELERRYERWREEGLVPLSAEIEARDALRGRVVRVGDVEAIARRILPDGRLEVELQDGGRRVLDGGEVRLVLVGPSGEETQPRSIPATRPDRRG
ncbi:MAG: biotin--[acetyl-CoA-carboxylase] ligase [Gaiellaceae bacterium]|nr:biotin--[acetyl-CoA-carboxylase] ligase [Gaiellaceae bacterium]